VKTRLTTPARRQAERIDLWWRENRPDVADLFAHELDAARRLIETSPEMGAPYTERHGTLVRRVRMPKTRNHVYYEVDDENGVAMILAVWGAPRGRGPKL
jgi:plasmid stabilization system protein ParE